MVYILSHQSSIYRAHQEIVKMTGFLFEINNINFRSEYMVEVRLTQTLKFLLKSTEGLQCM